MIQFPITDLVDEQECHDYLLRTLHPNGLECPTCGRPLPPSQAPHDRSRDPIFDYRRRTCGAVFNLFTKTIWSGTHYNCKIVVLVMRGFAQGIPTLHLAQELNLDYETLLDRRHQVYGLAFENLPTDPLPDDETEGDEMFQNAGEKGTPHRDPNDPPRRRANKRRGRGTMANDRPPVQGIVGRTTRQIRLIVCENTQQITIQPNVEDATETSTTFYTDEMPISTFLPQDEDTLLSVTPNASGLVTMTEMESVKCIATQWKEFGPVYAISCAFSEVFTKRI
ncbi:MAG: hypothetical protein GY832_25585 [Chloroflexi bacterium]|nr:hypothetical protein [Chloroflexota bacterium]